MNRFCVVAALAVAITGCGITNKGEGKKIGQIVRVSQEGVFCTTYEAQLIRGGMNGGSGSFGVQPFEFTIVSPYDAAKVEQYMNSQTEVVISYRLNGLFYSLCSSGSGGAFLTSIEPAPGDRSNS